jgi:tRNA dimethylallyltransferase
MTQKPSVTIPPVIIICGPTGIGKTALAIAMARRFGGEIVGADSMQIYRQMDIGTAKPTPREQAAVRHHMVDIVDPDEPFNAAMYADMAGNIVTGLHVQGQTPFVVGGTGLYIKALLHGLFEEKPPAADIRRRLKEEAKDNPEALYQRLKTLDAEAAERIHPNDTYRMIRALESLASTGSTISEQHKRHRFRPLRFKAFKICLDMDRKLLYDRIDRRVDLMIQAGFQAEVESLLASGYGPELKSMQSIGYRHMVSFLTGNITWDKTLELLKRDTRRYAKRQLTWFRADPQIRFYQPQDSEKIQQQIDAFLKGASHHG